jgi:hypothetical protein
MNEKDGEAVDLYALQVEPAEMKPTLRGTPSKPNPYADLVQQTWDEDRPLSVKAPARNAKSVYGRIRKAAMNIRLGVEIQFQVPPDGEVCPHSKIDTVKPDQEVKVVFKARELIKAARHEDDNDE